AFATRPDRPGFGIVQCKAVSRLAFRQKWLDDPQSRIDSGDATPPAPYRLQTLTEAMLNECLWSVLAVLVVGEHDCDFRLFDVERNAALEDRIRYCVSEFWHTYLDLNIMPPLDFERDAELVKELYPRDDGTIIDLRGNNRALAAVDELTETSAAIKRMQRQEGALKVELQSMLGEHTFGQLGDGRVLSWRTQHRKAYAVEASDYRVLRIVKAKPEDE
ncbi:MAG TPA: hypothetical protein VKE42_08120, partial [Candidatus Cybelea sp.]|nr:hypothetical protein [Candidatus Cybelea sp.]